MAKLNPAMHVAEDLLFDARLGLFHEKQRWLAVADLHFGYELSFQQAGALFPSFGMASVEQRLATLVSDYRPETLLLLGDHIHNGASAEAFTNFIANFQSQVPSLVLIQGNHDRALLNYDLQLPRKYRSGEFLFTHGHEEVVSDEIGEAVIGHWHPAVTIQDGCGLRQKFPALGRRKRQWILPAFSAWAAGGRLEGDTETEYWPSTGQHCFHKKSVECNIHLT